MKLFDGEGNELSPTGRLIAAKEILEADTEGDPELELMKAQARDDLNCSSRVDGTVRSRRRLVITDNPDAVESERLRARIYSPDNGRTTFATSEGFSNEAGLASNIKDVTTSFPAIANQLRVLVANNELRKKV